MYETESSRGILAIGGIKKMRIVVAAVSSNRSMSGVSRHAANLVNGLLMRGEVSALHLLVAPWEHKYVCDSIARADSRLHVHAVPLRAGTLHRNLWYYRTLPGIAEQLRADVVHFAYPSPIRAVAFPCPTVVSLHDLYPYDIPSNFGFPKVLVNRMILRQCLRGANAIACVSDSTRLRLGVQMPEAMFKAVTINNCVEGGPKPVKPSFVSTWHDAPFLLCVAQHRRNKNVMVALQAFRRLVTRNDVSQNTRLIVVGMPGPESAHLYRFVRDAHLAEQVVFVNGISDAELQWCYRNCELLLAPSTLEGFGLPVLEAQFAGCRIVCSDIPAFREAGGTGGIFVELGPAAEERFAQAVVSALRQPRPAPAHLPNLAPGYVSQQYVRLYQLLLAASGLKDNLLTIEAKSSLADEVPAALRS
jgi:glycosyltransferase involved in cell wall biosynthesis